MFFLHLCISPHRALCFFLFGFIGSTGAGLSPLPGGSFVKWLVKSSAILSDPMPRMMRCVLASRPFILLLRSWIGTTLGCFGMYTA